MNWSERIDFIKNATQETAKVLKNYEDAAFRKKTTYPNTDLTNSLCCRSGIQYSESSQGSNQRITGTGEFHADSGSSSGISHVPNQPLMTSSSRRKPSRASGLLRDTRNDMGIRGNDFEDLPAREGHPSEFFENSINLASSSRMTRKERTGNFHGERKRGEPRAHDDDTNTMLSQENKM